MTIVDSESRHGLRQAAAERAAELYRQGAMHSADVLLESIADQCGEDAHAQHLRGLVAYSLGQTDRAFAFLTRAIELNPEDDVAHVNLGTLLQKEYRHAGALGAFAAALHINPRQPAASCGLAKSFAELGLFDLAAHAYRDAIAGIADNTHLKTDLAALLNDMDDLGGASALFSEALQQAPERADTHTTRAISLFAKGDWVDAWREYEWRWKDPRYQPISSPGSGSVLWSGQDLSGKRLLVQVEQGLGDTIQFCRYITLLQERGSELVVQVQQPLIPLLTTAWDDARIISAEDIPPDCDFYIPLLSLPGLLGTTRENVPASIPYLHASLDLSAKWRERLGATSRRKVGLMWQGNPAHPCDRWRSMTLLQLAPLLDCPDVEFVSLQLGPGHEQLADLTQSIIDPTKLHDVASFADTAAIIAGLDLVISVDSAVAHLAGALGKPVWILLAARNDWRWLRQRDDTPWYPQARLFRQTALHDWRAVVQRVQLALHEWAGASPPATTSPTIQSIPDRSLCDALFMEAARQHQAGDVSRSKDIFERLLRIDPDHVDALCNLGAIERDGKRYESALSLLQHGTTLAPDHIPTRLILATTLLAAGQAHAAIAQLADTLRLAPNHASVHAQLAFAYRSIGHLDQALTHFRYAVEADQHQPATFYQALGETLAAANQLQGAEISLRHALSIDPELTAAAKMLATVGARLAPSANKASIV